VRTPAQSPQNASPNVLLAVDQCHKDKDADAKK
jgi:hypothetical protein